VSTLAEKLTKDPNRTKVVEQCCQLIDEEVKSKGGLGGMAVKAGYGLVKAVKPRFVPEVVNALLDEWVAKLEPHWADWSKNGSGKPFADHLTARGPEVADALLTVTDGRARSSKSGSVKKMYEKMRPSAKKHVQEALPRLAKLVEKEATSKDAKS
jgi:hypothetical protein